MKIERLGSGAIIKGLDNQNKFSNNDIHELINMLTSIDKVNTKHVSKGYISANGLHYNNGGDMRLFYSTERIPCIKIGRAKEYVYVCSMDIPILLKYIRSHESPLTWSDNSDFSGYA